MSVHVPLPSHDQEGGDRGPPGMEPDGEMEVREGGRGGCVFMLRCGGEKSAFQESCLSFSLCPLVYK